MENTRCPICFRNKVGASTIVDGYLQCIHCQTIWNPKFKNPQYKSNYYEGKSSIISLAFSHIMKILYKCREMYVGTDKKDLWIDVGAGDGGFLEQVNSGKKIGVEVSQYGRKNMEKRGIKTLSPEAFTKSRNLQADVISFWHVLEHVIEPKFLLVAAQKNLKENGRIIIGIPNANSFEFRLFKEKWFHFAPLHHKWHFTAKGLKTLLAKEGFVVQKIDYWSPEHQIAGLVQSFINITASSNNLLHKLVKRREPDTKIFLRDGVLIVFWLTLGLPIVFGFWVFAAVNHRPGTLVVVAQPRKL